MLLVKFVRGLKLQFSTYVAYVVQELKLINHHRNMSLTYKTYVQANISYIFVRLFWVNNSFHSLFETKNMLKY